MKKSEKNLIKKTSQIVVIFVEALILTCFLLTGLNGCNESRQAPLTESKSKNNSQYLSDDVPKSDELEMRGNLLHKEIKETYRKLLSANSISSFPSATDISYVLIKFIPINTTFDDAEKILNYAGFIVGTRPYDEPVGESLDNYGVHANLWSLDGGFFAPNPKVIALIIPVAAGNYSKVQEIKAFISITQP